MKTTIFHRLNKWLRNPTGKPTEEMQAEYARIRRRQEKFPRLRGAANALAHRNALFKERYGLNPEPPEKPAQTF